jgi:hypothetical protein
MPSPQVTTNFVDSEGVDLGIKLVTKDYLISVYPQIANNLITPELWMWGFNGFGQLGRGNATGPVCTPITTSVGGTYWKQVSLSRNHSGSVKADGTLWLWGNNASGQLAQGNVGSTKQTPVTTVNASGTNTWKYVACGKTHTAAIRSDGSLWSCGENVNGSLAGANPTGGFWGQNSAGGTNWQQVACGYRCGSAIKTDGTLWIWGGQGVFANNIFLGNGGSSNILSPSQGSWAIVGATGRYKQVAIGYNHIAAVGSDGSLWLCGNNQYGQLGTFDTVNRCTPVTTYVGGTTWKQVACGYQCTTAIKTDGTLWTWGRNTYYSLGVNDTVTRCTPITIYTGGSTWKQVSCAYWHMGAVKTDGSLWMWGNQGDGQLGNNVGGTSAPTPITTILGGNNWKQVIVGPYNSSAVKTGDDLQQF